MNIGPKSPQKLLFVKFLLYYIWSPRYKGHKDLDVIYFQKALMLTISLFNFEIFHESRGKFRPFLELTKHY